MQNFDVVIPVSIDAKIFRKFALFDSFVRQRRWRPLALFTAILLASAVVCFIMASKMEEAVLLGSVLTLVALGLPIVYIFSFLLSVKQQSEKMRLSVRRYAYTLAFNANDCITIKTAKEQLHVKWEDVFSVYRLHHAIYLYISQKKAYLLPADQLECSLDNLWRLMKSKVPGDRLFEASLTRLGFSQSSENKRK